MLFGGTADGIALNDLWIFSISSFSWFGLISTTNSIPGIFYVVARQNCGVFAAAFSAHYYVFGGSTAFGPQNDLWGYSLLSNKWEEYQTTNSPTPRSNFAYTNFNDSENEYFVVYGGLTNKGEDNGLYM